MTLISLEGVTKGFNDRVLLDDVALVVGDGERVGLLGANGSGKSTLLRILAGLEPPDEGTRVVKRGLRLGYLEQDPVLDPKLTARAAVRAGLGDHARLLADLEDVHARLEHANEEHLPRLLGEQTRLEQRLERLGGYDVEHRVESTLLALGLSEFDAPCGRLSGGERRRVALAQLLLGGPELLLLDEPTNHLDALVTDWLEDWFLETRTPLILVTHDRYFLDRVVDRIVELDRGRLLSYVGGYGDYLEARAARLDQEQRAESARLNLLRRETAWMRRGAPARTSKSKARIQRFHELAEAAPAELPVELVYEFPPGPRLGTRVLATKGITKAYDGVVVVPPLDLELGAGARLGIVGPNGAGKTTLLSLLLGELEPDAGERTVGETVRFMGVDQLRADLDLELSVAETVAGRSAVVKVGERTVRVESFLDKWGFPARARQTPIGRLSGGERARVLLAKLMSADGNVLFLDEPTNDLDLATLRALEEALLAFQGSAVVVSHDRWFLDRVATQILYLDGRGGARVHHGDLSSLLEKLAPRAPGDTRIQAEEAAESANRAALWPSRDASRLGNSASSTKPSSASARSRPRSRASTNAWPTRRFYKGARADLEQLQRQRSELETELATRYARWEELEALRSPG